MKVGLWSDCHNFLSLPLMKLSAYHKQRGDEVEMYSILEQYDLVYASKTFSFTVDIDEEYAVRADKLRKGGTGYEPCPKCGGRKISVVQKRVRKHRNTRYWYYYGLCRSCGHKGGLSNSSRGFPDAWNEHINDVRKEQK